MARNKKRDAWVAHLRVCVPIDATDPGTISTAQQKVRELANYIPGSTVEVSHAGFGRMAVGAMTPREAADARIAAERSAVTANAPPVTASNEPEIPDSLRRVPRYDGVGRGTPMDPSGDGSYRGPDGAA